MRILVVAAIALVAACAADAPCSTSTPGMRFVIHLAVEAAPPGELGVEYASGAVERFDQAIPAAPWADPLEVCVPYGPEAVDGRAHAIFTSRPEGIRRATADFTVDLDRRVLIEMTLELEAPDAGAPWRGAHGRLQPERGPAR